MQKNFMIVLLVWDYQQKSDSTQKNW